MGGVARADEGEAVTAPTENVRLDVYARDGFRCASCRGFNPLSYQHRAAVGMGGSRLLPTVVGGLTLCVPCNVECEGSMQSRALAFGWKIRRWQDATLVPVFYAHEFAWFRFEGTARVKITSEIAVEMMCAAHGDQWLTWWAGEKLEEFV